MTEKTKKVINTVSAVGLVVSTLGYVLTGGTEGGAISLASGAVALLSAGVLVWNLIKGKK